MQATGIEWTDASSNLLKYRDTLANKTVWACVKVSDGCRNCYSETIAQRWKRGEPFTLQQMRKLKPFFDMTEAGKLLRAKKLAGKRVFIDDMTDLFGDWVPDEIIDQHFAVFALRPDVTFQVLTKRPERMAKYLNDRVADDEPIGDACHVFLLAGMLKGVQVNSEWQIRWGRGGLHKDLPLQNVWLGTSCEDQKNADERIPHLLKCPAAVRFVSAEPLLGPIDFRFGDSEGEPTSAEPCRERHWLFDWIIIGGESGPGARPCGIAWIRSIVEQCKAADVACFVKQLGAKPIVRDQFDAWPGATVTPTDPDDPHYLIRLKDRKGGDIEEFPPELRVREFPQSQTVPV